LRVCSRRLCRTIYWWLSIVSWKNYSSLAYWFKRII